MCLLDRYVLRELGVFSVFAFAVTTGILLLNKLLLLTTFILQHHLDAFTSWRLIWYTFPTLSGLTLPVAFCLGCILTFHRLAIDGEYLAWQAAGVSVYRMLLPCTLGAMVGYTGSAITLAYVAPWGFTNLRDLTYELAPAHLTARLRAGEFTEMLPGIVVYCEEVNTQTGQLAGVFVVDMRASFPQVITAKQGQVRIIREAAHGMVHLQNGTIHAYVQAHEQYNVIRFGQYDITVDLTSFLISAREGKKPREFLPAQLQAEIQQREARGEDTRALRLHWHKLFALPFACFIFVGLGPVLGVDHPRSRRGGGYMIGLAGIFVYYLFLAASEALGEALALPPALTAWLPNLLMGSLTCWLLRGLVRGRQLLPASRRIVAALPGLRKARGA